MGLEMSIKIWWHWVNFDDAAPWNNILHGNRFCGIVSLTFNSVFLLLVHLWSLQYDRRDARHGADQWQWAEGTEGGRCCQHHVCLWGQESHWNWQGPGHSFRQRWVVCAKIHALTFFLTCLRCVVFFVCLFFFKRINHVIAHFWHLINES